MNYFNNSTTIPTLGEIFHKLGSMDFLKDHGVRVVAIDVIGYGKSDPPIHLPDSYETFFTEVSTVYRTRWCKLYSLL